MNFGPQMT